MTYLLTYLLYLDWSPKEQRTLIRPLFTLNLTIVTMFYPDPLWVKTLHLRKTPLLELLVELLKCFEELSFAWQFASISSPAGVSLNTSNQDRSEKMMSTIPDLYCLMS